MSSDLRSEFNRSPDGVGDWIVRISDQSEWGDYDMDEWTDLGVLPFFGPMSECPAEVLDKVFADDFGHPERPIYTVWTTKYIISPTEYDGATSVTWEERNPVPYPKANGGEVSS
jgi:hypothetical protein